MSAVIVETNRPTLRLEMVCFLENSGSNLFQGNLNLCLDGKQFWSGITGVSRKCLHVCVCVCVCVCLCVCVCVHMGALLNQSKVCVYAGSAVRAAGGPGVGA